MEYTMEERSAYIQEECEKHNSKNPLEIFNAVAKKDFVRIHGPEHHVLNGAAILTAYYNAGGKVNLPEVLKEVASRGLQVPGGACGMLGVCGAVTSIGAALSIIDETGPLSTDDTWGSHMNFTSKAVGQMAKIGGPRCCKRDGYLSITEAVKYINSTYDMNLEVDVPIRCDFFRENKECIENRCPYYPAK